MTITIYQYPNCGSCKKALKWLDTHGISYNKVHIVENPPTEDELAKFIKISGLPIKKFFNTSGKKYRELGLKDKIPTATEKELISLLSSDGMLIKRPIITDGEKVTVGFNENEFEGIWKSM